MAPVYAQINSDLLGSDLRDLNVATAYGHRLSEHCKNAKQNTVETLVSGYPSHNFIIDKAEAETLFERVESPSSAMTNLVAALGSVVYAEQSPCYVYRLDRILKDDEDGSDGPTDQKGGDDGSSVDSGRKASGAGNRRRKPAERKPAKSKRSGKTS